MRALICCAALLFALPASANSLERWVCQPAATVGKQVAIAVKDMATSEKLCRAFVRALDTLPEEALAQAGAMLAPESIEAMVALSTVWAVSQGVPGVGQAVDAALAVLSVVLLAVQAAELVEALWQFAKGAHGAQTQEHLDKAASHLSRALVLAGINVITCIFTKKAVGHVGAPPPSAPAGAVSTTSAVRVVAPAGAASSAATLNAANVAVMAVAGSQGPSPATPPPAQAQGPGQWKTVKPTHIEEARRYQEQITGQPASRVYVINGVEFDGFPNGVLKEAKGPGYSSFFEPNGQPKYWYENSGKLDELLRQARNQAEMARRAGLPLEWHVAEAEVVKFLQTLFARRNVPPIKLIHTPPASR